MENGIAYLKIDLLHWKIQAELMECSKAILESVRDVGRVAEPYRTPDNRPNGRSLIRTKSGKFFKMSFGFRTNLGHFKEMLIRKVWT